MKSVLFSIIFVLSYHVGKPQVAKGIIVDSISQIPIPYAHLHNSKTESGTMANEEGRFILSYKAENPKIKISCVGYQTKEIRIYNSTEELVIILKPKVILLQEVEVRDEATRVAKKVFEKLSSSTKNNFGKIFFRQIAFTNDIPTQILESFNDVSFTASGVESYKAFNARYATKKSDINDPAVNFTNFSLYSLGFSLLQKTKSAKSIARPFSSEYFDFYNFSINGRYEIDNKEYITIDFEPATDMKNPTALTGSFTVNLNDYSILNFTGMTRHSLGLDNLEFKTDSGTQKFPASNHVYSWDVSFRESDSNGTSNMLLGHVIFKTSFDWLYKGKRRESKLISKLIIYETGLKNIKGLKSPNLKDNDFNKIKSVKYDPNFWRDNPIIRKTTAEEDAILFFERSSSFGNYFDR